MHTTRQRPAACAPSLPPPSHLVLLNDASPSVIRLSVPLLSCTVPCNWLDSDAAKRHEMAPLQKRGKIVGPDSVNE